jgi:hypothetical protein
VSDDTESTDAPVQGAAESPAPPPPTVYNFQNAQGVSFASSSPRAAQAASNVPNGWQEDAATGTQRFRAGLVATWVGSVSGVVAVVVALLVWAPWKGESKTDGAAKTSSEVGINTNNGQVVVGGGGINNYGPPANNDPRAQIVQLTGSWSEQGFVNATVDRDTSIVDLYLKSGMKATTLHQGASAILFGFQGVPQNGDPVALVKTFQADGFKVDDQLQDSYLMAKLTRNFLPLMFHTDLAPKGYTGGYQDGTFIGSLLFWIVQRGVWMGPGDQDIQVIKYLISQGADCKVPLSFLNYNGREHTNKAEGTNPYDELIPMMQSCAK